MQKITPFLWYANQAEEAMNYYVKVFNKNPHKNQDSKIVTIQYYPDNVDNEHMKGMEGKVLTGIFELEGQQYMCLDGGSIFTFNESVSLLVECDGQEEVDYFWNTFTQQDGQESECGWLKDKYGLSWQIVPKQYNEIVTRPDKEKVGKVMEEMLKMKKINIAKLEEAYNR
ncbi:MAG TPA: VOC family protein [Candidatus Woesebacteria bacterium]|nr:VOC family protein [Candidatus Woesebacteria bacterium]